MSFLYLVRHAQAGSRQQYDALSALGSRQAEALRDHFVRQGMRFDAAYAGSLRRQQQTAQSLLLADGASLITDERWNEFRLGEVYRGLAEWMCANDEAFAQDYREMQRTLAQNGYAMGGAVARCDRSIMRAWMAGHYPAYGGESWRAFRERVLAALSDLAAQAPGTHLLVSTSATPVAICVGQALGLGDEQVLELTGVIYNASLTTFRLRRGELKLFTFNATPAVAEGLPQTLR